LELRRIRADLVKCYEIIDGLVDIPFDAFFKFSTSSTRGHPLRLYYSDSRVNARAHSFPVRIVTLWNRLPAATALSGSLQSFKSQLKILINYALLGKINISLCCMCFRDFNLCFICLSILCLIRLYNL